MDFLFLISFLICFLWSSTKCQSEHWRLEHKMKCSSSNRLKAMQHVGGKRNTAVALIPSSGREKTQNIVNKVSWHFCWKCFMVYVRSCFIVAPSQVLFFQVLFPYDEFVKLYNWDKSIFPPCGLLNCGNRFVLFNILYLLACFWEWLSLRVLMFFYMNSKIIKIFFTLVS